MLLWVGFLFAVLLIAIFAIIYWRMQSRRKKLQLQKAVAEGKVVLKDDGDQTDEDGNRERGDVEMSERAADES